MATTWRGFRSGVVSQMMALVAGGPTSVAETTLALSSAYVYGTGPNGHAVSYLFQAPESANLTEVWINVKSFSGTWASTDGVINVEIREGLNGNSIPGTTLTGSFTVTLDGTTTGYIKKTGLAIALTAGRFYNLVIADADGGATNFCTISTRLGSQSGFFGFSGLMVTTTNSFSTTGTQTGVAPTPVIKLGNHFYGGASFSTISTLSPTSMIERGNRFRPQEDCVLIGTQYGMDSSILMDGFTYKLYADGTAPGGATLMSYTPATTARGGATSPNQPYLLFPEANWTGLSADVWYRFVIVPNVNTTVPRKITLFTSGDTDMRALMMPFGDCHWIEDNAGAWDDAQLDSYCLLGPVVVPRSMRSHGRFQLGI